MQRRAPALSPGARIAIAPMGIDAFRLVRTKSGPWSTGNPLRLAAISDLSSVKRVPLAIAALDRLLARGVDATLDIFGDLRGNALGPHARVTMHGVVSCAARFSAILEDAAAR